MKKAHLFLIFSIISYVIFTDCPKALLLADESASDLRTKGYAAQHDGDTDKAIELYEKALRLEPSALLYNDLGVCYEGKGLYEKAEEHYLKAAKLKDDYAAVYTNLAIFYENKGELTKAAYHWQKRLGLAKDGDRWAETAREHLKFLPKIKLAKESERAPQRVIEKERPKPAEKKPHELKKDMPPYLEKPMPPKKIEEEGGNRGYLFGEGAYKAQREKTKEELMEEEVRRLAGKTE